MFSEMTYFNGVQETVPDMLKVIEKWGSDETYPHMAVGWVVMFDTPYTWTKQVASDPGGTKVGMAIHWPKRIKAKGELRTQFHHVIDVAPTILEAAQLPEPTMVNGIKAAWVAQLSMGDNAKGVSETVPYRPTPIARKSGVGWNKGTTVILLDDAEGNTWILKGFQMGLEPEYTYDGFVARGQDQFKELPAGWKFRVKTLKVDLIEIPEGGKATIMADEFFDVYDKTGLGMSNYKP